MSFEHIFAKHLLAVIQAYHPEFEGDVDLVASWVEAPKDRELGDLAFPCFRLAKPLRKPPAVIAAALIDGLRDVVDSEPMIAEVSQVGPYLNARINRAGQAKSLIPQIMDGSFTKPRARIDHRVMIEYSQPNTHKAFHVGHMRNVALGDALVRIYRWCGFPVVAANYIGDVGTHIAKCLWYLERHFSGEIPEQHRGEFLGTLYFKATELLDFDLLTRCPLLGVHVAQVMEKDQHPSRPEWTVVTLDLGHETCLVVCGGTGFEVGDRVAYASLGSRVGGRVIERVDKDGVLSEGMILSGAELGLNDNREAVFVLEPTISVGTPIADVFARKPNENVAGTMQQRLNEVSETLKRLESGEPEITALWQKTKQWSMDEFYEIYQWLDCHFDHFFFESDVGDEGKAMVEEYLQKGVLVRSQGTVGAELEGLPFLMLLKSDGTGLYATKDLALARRKFDEFGIDESIYVVDVSQSLHFQQVFKTLELMGFEQAKQCYHLAYGLVVLRDGKMSSRAGNVILFSQLRELLDQRIKSEFLEKYRGDWSDREIDDAAHAIAIATIKYGMLNQDHNRMIVFDLEEWTSQTGNTGPYLMYAYARTQSILKKVGTWDVLSADYTLLSHEAEGQLIDQLGRFQDVVASTREGHRPRELCAYLYDLARAFSRMFDQCSVLRADTVPLKAARANLVRATGEILATGLHLLGIPPLERM